MDKGAGVTRLLCIRNRLITVYLLGITLILLIFGSALIYASHKAVKDQEKAFNQQQALQTMLVKQAFEDHIAMLSGHVRLLAKWCASQVRELPATLSALENTCDFQPALHPEIMAYVYVDHESDVFLRPPKSDCPESLLKQIALQSYDNYEQSDPDASSMTPYIAPLYVSVHYQLMAIVCPLPESGGMNGAMVCLIDFHQLSKRYVGAMRSGKYGAGYMLNGQGTVIYDHEEHVIGRNVKDGLHADYPDLLRVDHRLLTEESGMDRYEFTVQRGGEVRKKLTAWNAFNAGTNKLIIALAAPDSEIDAVLFGLRMQIILLMSVFVVTVLFSSALFYHFRQKMLVKHAKMLEQMVDERTHELAESEEKFSTMFRSGPTVIVLQALDNGELLDVNQAFVEKCGMDASEVIGKTPTELKLWADPEKEMIMRNHVQTSGRVESGEAFFRIADGRIVPAVWSAEKVRIKNRDCVLFSAYDISERMKAEAERRHMEIQMQQIQRLESLGVLAGGIAHDFSNLLGALFGNIDLACHFIRTNSIEKAEDVLGKAMSVFQRAKDLTQQLLTFSKGGVPSTRLVAVEPLLRKNARFVLGGTNVSAVFHIADDLWNCELDVSQFDRAIDNLLINALQAMAPDSGTVTFTAENVQHTQELPHLLRDRQCIRIQITDTGPGIPPDIAANIFDPFFTTKASGSGLGLATAFSIISKHEGVIELDAHAAQTTFVIYLPATHEAADVEEDEQQQMICGRGRVLVMDDEGPVREFMRMVLEEGGFEIGEAADTEEVLARHLESIQSPPYYDYIILDLVIPGGEGGKDVAPIIRKRQENVILIATSGYSDDPVMADPHSFGFDYVLRKPFIAKDIMQCLLTARGAAVQADEMSRADCGGGAGT
ncbi:MAG: hybrid sensor histidine kinase/response regulator [Spartobacteria bacterium]|nr:hybrid sensor histidine kinase/response regulator [Spartobacteria bacterium]